MNTRLLGIAGMISAPMLLVEGILNGFQQVEVNQLIGVLSLIYSGGWMCSVIGLRRLSATGSRVPGKAILVVQLVLLALAIAWALIHVANPSPNKDSVIYQITDVAWPLSHVFMLVVGIAALVARVLPRWQRITPLLCGLALPGAILGGVVGGELTGAIAFGVHTAVAFLLLGYTVFSTERGAAPAYAGSSSLEADDGLAA